MYRTGDRARHLRDGRMEFLGRVDEQVKIRGFRVEPAEIESVLLKHPAVHRAAVSAWKPSPSETRLAAYVVPFVDADSSVSVEPQGALVPRLRGHLQSHLPEYMLPSAILLLDSLPLTAGGKLNRRALPEPESVPLDRTGARAPQTPTEEVLAEIWAAVLGLPRVGVDDDFFELGGHSLKASELMFRVRESFSVDLPLRTAFESPTVATMAPMVDAAIASGGGFAIPRVEAAPRDGPVPLSYAQEGAWWVDRLEPGIPFNIPVVLRLEGDLRVEILESALNEVVRRHEALRTNFSSIDGEPFQLIAEHRAMTVPVLDLTTLHDSLRKERLLLELTRVARTRFDLSGGRCCAWRSSVSRNGTTFSSSRCTTASSTDGPRTSSPARWPSSMRRWPAAGPPNWPLSRSSTPITRYGSGSCFRASSSNPRWSTGRRGSRALHPS
jgi:acyl carrier protein